MDLHEGGDSVSEKEFKRKLNEDEDYRWDFFERNSKNLGDMTFDKFSSNVGHPLSQEQNTADKQNSVQDNNSQQTAPTSSAEDGKAVQHAQSVQQTDNKPQQPNAVQQTDSVASADEEHDNIVQKNISDIYYMLLGGNQDLMNVDEFRRKIDEDEAYRRDAYDKIKSYIGDISYDQFATSIGHPPVVRALRQKQTASQPQQQTASAQQGSGQQQAQPQQDEMSATASSQSAAEQGNDEPQESPSKGFWDKVGDKIDEALYGGQGDQPFDAERLKSQTDNIQVGYNWVYRSDNDYPVTMRLPNKADIDKHPWLKDYTDEFVPFLTETNEPIYGSVPGKYVGMGEDGNEQYELKKVPAAPHLPSTTIVAVQLAPGVLNKQFDEYLTASGVDVAALKAGKLVDQNGKKADYNSSLAEYKQGMYESINALAGKVRQELILASEDERRQYVEQLYKSGTIPEFVPKDSFFRAVNAVTAEDQMQEVQSKRLQAQWLRRQAKKRQAELQAEYDRIQFQYGYTDPYNAIRDKEAERRLYDLATMMYMLDAAMHEAEDAEERWHAVQDQMSGENTGLEYMQNLLNTSGITKARSWDFDVTHLLDAVAMADTKRGLQKNKVNDDAYYITMQALLNSNASEAQLDKVMGTGYKGANMGLEMLPMAVQVLLSRGVVKAIGSALKVAGAAVSRSTMVAIVKKMATELEASRLTGMVGKTMRKYLGKDLARGLVTTFRFVGKGAAIGGKLLGKGAITSVAPGFIAKTAGDVVRDNNGHLEVDYNSGEYRWDGHPVKESIMRSAWQNSVMNGMIYGGEYMPFAKWFSKLCKSKAGQYLRFDQIEKVFSEMNSSEYVKAATEFGKQFGIHSPMRQMAEMNIAEMANAAVQPLGLSDQQWSDIANLDHQAQLFESIMVSAFANGCFANIVRKGKQGIDYTGFLSAKRNMTKWDAVCKAKLGDKWAELKEELDNCANTGYAKALCDIIFKDQSGEFTRDQKNAIMNYGTAVMRMRGTNTGYMQLVKDGTISLQDTINFSNRVQGRSAKGDECNQIRLAYETSRKSVAEKLGIAEENIDKYTDEQLKDIAAADQNPEGSQAVFDYLRKKYLFEGVKDSAQDTVIAQVSSKIAAESSKINQQSGTFQMALLKGMNSSENHPVYIVSGHLERNPDGSINKEKSSKVIYYYDQTTGKPASCDPSMFLMASAESSAQEYLKGVAEDTKQAAQANVDAMINGEVYVGAEYKILDEQGNEHTYKVVAGDGKENITLEIDGKEMRQTTKEAMQQTKDVSDAARAAAETQPTEQAAASATDNVPSAEGQRRTETAPVEDTFDYSRVIDPEGKVTHAEVLDENGESMYPDSDVFFIDGKRNGKSTDRVKVAIVDADGNIMTKWLKRNKVRMGETISLDEHKQIRRAQLEAERQTEPTEEAAAAPGNNVPEAPDETAPANTPDAAGEGTGQGPAGSNQTATFRDGTPIPVDENGEVDLSSMDAEHAAEWYIDNLGEDAKDVVSRNVAEAKKALEDAKSMKVQGSKPSELKNSAEAKKAAVEAAQRNYDRAKAVADVYSDVYGRMDAETPEGRKGIVGRAISKARRMMRRAQSAAEKSKIWQDTVLPVLNSLYGNTTVDVNDMTPQTLDEYVASGIGPRSLNYEGKDHGNGMEGGLKQELGINRGIGRGFDTNIFNSLIAKKGEGKTIPELAHELWQNRPEHLKQYTDQDIRNALLDLLQSADSSSYITDYVLNRRIEQAEKEIAGELAAMDEARNMASTEEPAPSYDEASQAESDQPFGDSLDKVPFSKRSRRVDNEEGIRLSKKSTRGRRRNDWQGTRQERTAPAPEERTHEASSSEPRAEVGTGAKTVEPSSAEEPVAASATGQTATEAKAEALSSESKQTGYLDSRQEKIDKKIDEKIERTLSEKDEWYKNQNKTPLAELKKREVKAEDIPEEKMPKELRESILALAKQMGVEVKFLDQQENNGWYERGDGKHGNGTVYLSTDPARAVEAIFGHEMLHDIKAHSPEAYEGLKEAVKKFLGENRYAARLEATKELYKDESGYDSEEDFEEEVIADTIGQLLYDGDMTRKIAYRLEHPILGSLRQAADRVKNYFTGSYWGDVVLDFQSDIFKAMKDAQNGTELKDGEESAAAKLAKRKRALETASLGENPRSLTVVSSADGAKVLKNIDTLATKFDNSATQPKTFIGFVAKALGAERHGSASEYATFETMNGNIVTIRLLNHSAKVSNFDNRGENYGISIVVSPKKSGGITNDGAAHVVEYYYDAVKLRRANGNPLAVILRSIKQALYSGEYKDKTGFAEKQDVNADDISQFVKKSLRTYHGTHADFDRFDHSHMGEGEGAQAYGWGTYVTDLEDIGRFYADEIFKKNERRKARTSYGYSGNAVEDILWQEAHNGESKSFEQLKAPIIENLESDISDFKRGLENKDNQYKEYLKKDLEEAEAELAAIRRLTEEQYNEERIKLGHVRHLYEVDIPDDTGSNYLDWDKRPSESQMESVSKRLEEDGVLDDEDNLNALRGAETGQDLYGALEDLLGSDKAASEFLSSLGFVGIRYAEGKLYGGRDAIAKNYVIFNEDDAQIVEHTKFSKRQRQEIVSRAKESGTYMQAPNAEVSHLTPEQWADVRTDNFKKFFGDWENDPENASKVVDENGEPKVMYHGSGDEKFTEFKKGDIGYHFGNRDQAMQRNYMTVDHEGNIMPVYLDIKNPLTIEEDAGNWHGNGLAKYLMSDDSVTAFGHQREGGKGKNPFTSATDMRVLEEIASMKDEAASDMAMRLFLEGKGYDGIRYANEVEQSPDEANDNHSYIAFRPNQIKSVEEVPSEGTLEDVAGRPDATITDSTGEPVAVTDSNSRVKLSLRTDRPWTDNYGRRHKGTREMVLDYLSKTGASEQEIKEFSDEMDYWHSYLQKIADFKNPDGTFKFKAFHDWNLRQPQYKKIGGKIEKTVVTAIKNGEYAVNQELSTDCIKREAFTKLVNTLVAEGADLSDMGPRQIAVIKDMMRKYGVQVACDLCFVEGKRLGIVNWAKTFVDDWNRALESMGLKADELEAFNFGGYARDAEGNLIDDAVFVPTEELAGNDASQFKAINEVFDILGGRDKAYYDDMKARNEANWIRWRNKNMQGWKAYKQLKKEGRRWSDKYLTKDQKKIKASFLTYGVRDPQQIYRNSMEYAEAYQRMEREYLEENPGGVFQPDEKQQAQLDKIRNKKIADIFGKMQRLIAEHPEMRKRMQLSDLLGSKGLMQIRQENGSAHAQLWSLILGRFGSGTPKPIQDAVPYSGEVYDITEGLLAAAYVEGGARMFSFSDFDVTKMFDIMQIVWDMAARKMKLQSYTKEAAFVTLFGKNGIKINISTLPKAVVPKELSDRYRKAAQADKPAIAHEGSEYAGLVVDEQGNIVDMSWSEEHSAKPDFCQMIFRDPERNGDCGAITVGASVNHAIWAAAQDWIRMVIPFHLSGMPIAARERTDVNWYYDNTKYQNTRIPKRGKGGIEYVSVNSKYVKDLNPKLRKQGKPLIEDYNFYANEGEGWDMRQECRKYIDWCERMGYLPRFDWGINSDHYRDFCKREGFEPNQQIIDLMDSDMTDGVWNGYYKFITDFNCYKPVLDADGEPMHDSQGHLVETVAHHTPVRRGISLSDAERKAIFGDADGTATQFADNSVMQNRSNSINNADTHMPEMAREALDYLVNVHKNKEGGVSDAEIEEAEAMMKGEGNKHFNSANDAELIMSAEDTPVRKSLRSDRSLVGVHNISEEKLLKALKLGGLANPSVAVIDSDRQEHSGYGEISLIMPSEKIAKRTGKNAGTFFGDAWTPTYPNVTRTMTQKGYDKVYKDVRKLPKEMQSEMRRVYTADYLEDGRTDGLAFWYLHDIGKNPEVVMKKSNYAPEVSKAVSEATDGFRKPVDELSDGELKAIIEQYAKSEGKTVDEVKRGMAVIKDGNQKVISDLTRPAYIRNIRQRQSDEIDRYGITKSRLNGFISKARFDMEKSGKPDVEATRLAAMKMMNDENLAQGFADWLEKKDGEYGVKEVIFDGFTPSGNRRYVPNDLEHVSRIMKKSGLAGASGSGFSFNNFAATIMERTGSLSELRKRKGMLTENHADMDVFSEKWGKVYNELADAMNPNPSGFLDDAGYYRLAEAALQSDPKAYAKKEYGVDLTDKQVEDIRALVNAIRKERPTMYFETKFERPVGFDEFTAAVVPSTLSGQARRALAQAGIDVVEYDPNVEGDRKRAFQETVSGNEEKVKFSLIGKRGAAALDHAEEVTIRVDNLDVARQMEGEKKDAKSIKMATGWERGADGQWRYEVPDPLIDGVDKIVSEKVEKQIAANKPLSSLRLTPIKLADAIGEDHPLLKAYPELAKMKIKFKDLGSSTAAQYDRTDRSLTIHSWLAKEQGGLQKYLKTTLAHEIQHAIQHIEGFAAGGNTTTSQQKYISSLESQLSFLENNIDVQEGKYALAAKDRELRERIPWNGHEDSDYQKAYRAILQEVYEEHPLFKQYKEIADSKRLRDARNINGYEFYNRLSGEVEARNVERRMKMTPEERRQSLAAETEDVARDDQMFLYGDGGASASEGKVKLSKRQYGIPSDSDMPLFGMNVAEGEKSKEQKEFEAHVITRRIGSRAQAQERVNETLAAAASDYRRNFGTAETEQRNGWEIGSSLRYVIPRSKELLAFIEEEELNKLCGERVGGGGENIVFRTTYDNKKVIKLNSFFLTDDAFRLSEFVDRINAHNEFMPEDQYAPLGFAYNEKGEFSIVMEQPYIKGTHPKQEEIDKYLIDHGFHKAEIEMSADEYGEGWSNGTLDLWDAKEDNVIKDENGDLHFVDTNIQHRNMPFHKDKARLSLRNRSDNYDERLAAWKERNGLAEDAEPMEKPVQMEGESATEFMERIVNWTKDKNLWKTAPKPAGYWEALEDWKKEHGIPAEEFPPTRPRRQDYETEEEYDRAIDQYNRDREKWQAPQYPNEADYPDEIEFRKAVERWRREKEEWTDPPKGSDYDLSYDMSDVGQRFDALRKAVTNQRSYDQRTVAAVTDLIREMIALGWGDNMGRGAIKRLLSVAKNVNGQDNVKRYIDKAMGILTDNYLASLKAEYDRIKNIKDSRLDQTGVVRVGQLDAIGQGYIKEYRRALEMDEKHQADRISDLDWDSSENPSHKEANEAMIDGIVAAQRYRETIGQTQNDIDDLQRMIGDMEQFNADNKYSTDEKVKAKIKANRSMIKTMRESIEEHKAQLISMYNDHLELMGGSLADSRDRAHEFREKVKQRKHHVLDLAKADMEGLDASTKSPNTLARKFWENPAVKIAMSSAYSFEQYMKLFGYVHNPTGEGYLYNHYMKLWMDAINEQQTYMEDHRKALDQKASEIFGKKVKFNDLISIKGKGYPTATVEITDLGSPTGKRTATLTQGQILYMYLCSKETDGRMKLEAMGITPVDVANLEATLNPKIKELGEWIQNEYLPEQRSRYQERHVEFFGAPMREVDNYFPLNVNQRAVNKQTDIGQTSAQQNSMVSTATGAIVTRRVNTTPLDEETDAFAAVMRNLSSMEEWSAMLPFRTDINTLLSSTEFKNQVMNMSSKAYGNGDSLWKQFKQCAQIASGTYRARTDNESVDKRFMQALGLVSMAKISWRFWTAFKQTLSAPAFLTEADTWRFMKNSVNPYGSYKWAYENLPIFRKRVENMAIGDTRIKELLDNVDKTKNWLVNIGNKGMIPNVFVDAVTCAVGARSVYESEYHKLVKSGYSREQAEEKALQKAAISYNRSQQSSEGAFVSPLQVDRTYLSSVLSLFKNSPYSYGRNIIDAARGLSRTMPLWGNNKNLGIEAIKKRIMQQDGITDEATAYDIAKKAYNRTRWKSIATIVNYFTVMPILWSLGGNVLYCLMGDDDDKKKDMILDAAMKGFATTVTDDYAIPFVSDVFINSPISFTNGEFSYDMKRIGDASLYKNPATSDIANMLGNFSKGNWGGILNRITDIGVQAFTGFNPQTLGNVLEAFSEWDGKGDMPTEAKIALMKVLNAPEDNVRNLLIDELGLNRKQAGKMTVKELEKRYALRQMNRQNGLTQYLISQDKYDELIEKYAKSFEDRIKGYMDQLDDRDKKKTDAIYDSTLDPVLREMIEKKRAKDVQKTIDNQLDAEGIEASKKPKAKYEEEYDSLKTTKDLKQEGEIKRKEGLKKGRMKKQTQEYNALDEFARYDYLDEHPEYEDYLDKMKEIDWQKNEISDLLKSLPDAKDKQAVMRKIRKEREVLDRMLDEFD